MNNRIYKIPIYGGNFNVVFYTKADLSLIKTKYNAVDIENYDAVTYYKNKQIHLLFDKNKVTPGIIAHESKHALNYVFEYIGQRLDVNNDEAECYFLSWIVNRVHESCRKFNIKIK